MMRAWMLGLAFAGLAGCHTSGTRNSATPVDASADTLRGTFVLEGSDPMPVAVLRTAEGRVELDGVPAAMRGLVQLDLWVRGAAEAGGRFRVAEFLVRGAGGEPARDGTVERAGDDFALRLADGTLHALLGVPADFGRLVGQRVWITETAAHTLASYGVIR
jgi:hypothetical protein